MANIAANPIHILAIQSRTVTRLRTSFEPATRSMATITKLPNTRNVLIGNCESSEKNRVPGGLGHHPAPPGKERISKAIFSLRMAHLALLNLRKLNSGLLRLHAGQKYRRDARPGKYNNKQDAQNSLKHRITHFEPLV